MIDKFLSLIINCVALFVPNEDFTREMLHQRDDSAVK